MGAFEISLLLTTLLCSLVAGLVFTFAVVVMPGLGRLGDAAYIRSFQVIDAIIQESQPIFVLVWVGSIAGLIATLILGVRELTGLPRLLLVLAAAIFLFAVHLPTFRVNVPLNNRLQALDVETLDGAALANARSNFEPAWNRWNTFRAIFSVVGTLLLLTVLGGLAP